MDGENSSIYADGYFHIRSIDKTRPSKDGRAKAWSQLVSPLLSSDGYHRMVFENLHDQHSIHYKKDTDNPLQSYYQCLFITKIIGDEEWTLPYTEQIEFCNKWGVGMPPLLAISNGINSLSTYVSRLNLDLQEGVVVRSPESFRLEDLSHYVGKWVRPNHVQTDEKWHLSKLEPNEVVYMSEDLLEYGFFTA